MGYAVRAALLLLAAAAVAVGAGGSTVSTVSIDWDAVVRVSKTTTTLQVVSNPILDREFTNTTTGQRFKNPIHDNAFASLANLNAEMVRYVPWFPYPWKSVAELEAPTADKPTSWNFTFVLPQLEDFMGATHLRNKTTVINFSTQPCWLYNSADCSVPPNPDQSDFGYVRGTALRDPTAKDLGRYYGRLLSYLMQGNFTDEKGVLHTGGPGWSNMTYWEVFNEAEHHYNVSWYTHDYDVVVSTIRQLADPEHRLKFVGIGGASPSWYPYFLNRSNHLIPDIPLDYVSTHFYARCTSRSDPTTFTQFFDHADGFIANTINTILPSRDAHSPETKIDFDELGVIMPDDNDPKWGIDGGLPDIYWNAAGTMYAYLFAHLSVAGVDVLGHSQLAGSPKIPEWNIPLPQYPSVSLLDWRTGYGNARYWVLKLLIDSFAPGDAILNTTTAAHTPATNPFCGESAGASYPAVTLSCAGPTDTMDQIQFADWGTPSGACGAFAPVSSCTDRANATAFATNACLGKHSCTLAPYPALGDPCYDVLKRFVVQAHCTGAGGGSNSSAIAPVHAQAYRTPAGARQVLLTNRVYSPQTVTGAFLSAATGMLFVDNTTVTHGGPTGIGAETIAPNTTSLTLSPFMTAVVQLRG